ncbi:hypothetical protein RJ639_046716 [Escallonia herrerae]|uniref:Reverse transcriptase Ty1/copia-type domain-containing protein n=1 Tax=Escallonia herrerae TaxID=1293975 RepID=A0AA89B5R9_9ASTE|nr:hypothetical protein RJ639_046716 [Escallonia herrerae]
MQEELDALGKNHTWDLVPYPPRVTSVGCIWVCTTKLHSDGTLDRYKARLVALGNRQEYRVNYDKIFAPDLMKLTRLSTALSFDTPTELNVKYSKDSGNLSRKAPGFNKK